MAEDKDKTESVLQDKIDEVKAKEGQDMEMHFDSATYAPKFQEWIDDYEADIQLFKEIVADETAPPALRRLMAGGLMYVVRVIDLVPDSYRPVGTIDDTLVLRILADLSAEWTAELQNPKHMKAVFKLANDAETIREFLGEDTYRELENYVRGQPDQATHGITGEAAAKDAAVRKELLAQVDEELKSFRPVAIDDGARAERELKSYLHAKLGK
jgi:uncharacterized membrane protein YkvA (DUF1232 family)